MRRTQDILPEVQTITVQANGLQFEVDTMGEGDRLVLCLHGFPEHSVSWRFQMPFLAELGYRVWAPNLRGYGNSDAPKGVKNYQLEVLMEDVGALIDAANASEVILMAHDWGAVIAWHFAMREIRPLKQLVICNVPHPVPAMKAMGSGLEQLKKSWYIFFFQLPWFPERMMARGSMGDLIRSSASAPENYSSDVVALFEENGSRPENLTAMVNYYRALVRGGGSARQRKLGFPKIETPTLMLWGEDVMALSMATTFGTDAHVSDLTLRYFPGISHWVQQDAPVEANAMLKAFLAGDAVPQYASLQR